MGQVRHSILGVALSVVLTCGSKLFAAASVTAATGGGAIPADTVGGGYTTLTGPKLAESDKTGIDVGTIVLTAPAGFEFNPTATVTVAITGRGRGSYVALSNSVATVTTNTIEVNVVATSSNSRKCTLTWSGIKVRPKFGTPLASGTITRSGTSSFTESGSAGNYGTLN